MDIQELNKQLAYLEETKSLMKQTLIDKGQPVDDNTTFREYVDNMDILIDTEDGNIVSNDLELGKKAYSQGNEIIGTYDIDKDIGVQPLEVFEISDDQSALRQYYADGVAEGGMEALASLKCWQILFVENTLNSDGVPTKHSVEFLSWTPAIIEIDRPRDMLSNSGKHRFLFDQAHTQLFTQFDTALGLGYTAEFLNIYNITTVELQAMSGWYEDVNGVLTPMQSNPVYNNLMITYLFGETLQDVISGVKNQGMPYMNIDEVKLNCNITKFDDYDEEQPVMDFVIEGYRDDGDVSADEMGKDKVAYGVNGKVTGTIPIVEADDYALLNRTQSLNSGDITIMERTYKNINDGTVTELVMSNGTKLDISTLPENVDNKNIFIVYGKNSYNVYWWFLFITDIGNSICLASHDYTYAVVCKNKGNRATNKDMVYYRGNTPYVEGVPFDINNVNWGNQIVWDKSTGVELNLSQQGLNVYATDTVYRGQFGSYGTEQFSGSMDFRYYQDNKIGISPTSGLVQNSSQLFKENSHALVPINTRNIVGQENITADKIKSGETILGVTGTFTNDGNVTAGDVGSGKIAYANGQKITGNVPLVEADNYLMLSKTENITGGLPYQVNSLHYNVNDGTVSEIMFSNGQKLDLSTLPEDITGKNVFIYYGTDINFDRWGLFITDMDSTICLSAHDDTFALTCLDKATRRSARDISYYMGVRTKTGNIDINNVNWGTKTVWDKRYLIELYLTNGNYNVYTTNDVYRGQFGSYSNPVFAGSSNYLYYQDNILKTNGVATTQVISLLAKANSHICTAINTGELITKENITSDKIKSGETILGVSGKSSVVETDDATAYNSDIASGKTAYVNGSKVVGELRDKRNDNTNIVGADVTGTNQYRVTLTGTGNSTPEIINSSTSVKCEIANNLLASGIGLTADKIKQGVTIIGVTGTYTGSSMKEYASETAMNNDIANISEGELVKVVESGTTSYFIKETIDNVPTMTKLVKESETMSPQEYEDANDIADEILGE